MTKRMLIDATHLEETRVAVVSGNRLEEYDFESVVRRQLKGNIYLVKVTRVEPSLQAAFVDFGGNRHGFLPFPEIHPDYYRIPIADREALLAEERALAAAQAAQQDAEDEAELAALGHSLDDFDDLDKETENDDSTDDVQAAATVEIVESVTTEHDIEVLTPVDDHDDDHSESGETVENGAETIAADVVLPTISEDTETTEASTDLDSNDDEESDLDLVGGDSVETPVFRSSIKRRYKIQEVIKRGQIMLIQISKEERGNKGAAVTSYISLPGRYCVLMPNSPRGGGVSRKVSNARDRQRLKKILQELNVPEGMSVILRTAGVSRTKAEIKRDLDYLLRLWDQIRELTLQSSAPALIYEEGNLIKRAIRDLYKRDIDEVLVAGEQGFNNAREFMKTLSPSHAERVQLYSDENAPLFLRYQVEKQIDEIHNPTVHLKSGGYIVINPTEALVSIDVNSGRATKGRHIEETALKTNIEAAEEIARQLRLRDLGGLIVIDFIDMEDRRSNRTVENKLRDAMAGDRARIQLGRISAFGLLELSRQRLHPSLVETNFEVCKHCNGTGLVRTVETAAVMILRSLQEEGMKARGAELRVATLTEIALYIFNHKRHMLADIENRYGVSVTIHSDNSLTSPAHTIEVVRSAGEPQNRRPKSLPITPVIDLPSEESYIDDDNEVFGEDAGFSGEEANGSNIRQIEGDGNGRNNRRGRRRGGRDNGRRNGRNGNRTNNTPEAGESADLDTQQPSAVTSEGTEARVEGEEGETPNRSRRRGRRGGRRRSRNRIDGHQETNGNAGGQNAQPYDANQPQPVVIAESLVANQGSTAPGEPAKVGQKTWWKRLTE